MKLPNGLMSTERLQQEYPIVNRLPGWLFRVDEVSAGAWRAEGTDILGRQVGHSGMDPEELLERCIADARYIVDSMKQE